MSLNSWFMFCFCYRRLLGTALSFVICCICREKQPRSVSHMLKHSAVQDWYWIFKKNVFIFSERACCRAQVVYNCCCCFVWPEALCSGEVRQMYARWCPAAFNQIGLKADVNFKKRKKTCSEGQALHISSLVCALDLVCYLLTSHSPDMHSDQ